MPASDLIDVAELADTLAGPIAPRVLDVRWNLGGPPGRVAYLDGHIPGAAFCDLDHDLAAAPGPAGRHPLPDSATFGTAMRRLGVTARHPVVVYDGADSTAAARAWWCLRYFGHPRVRVLDGGWRAWVDAGRPQEPGPARIVPGDFVATAGAMPVVDANAAADLARHGRLVDVRAPARYRGESEPVDPVAGHIPGALSLPTGANLAESGRFRSPPALRDRFAKAQLLDGDAPVGVYCGSGVTAAHTVLALALVGQPAALYVGSWSEWITDPERPVAVGANPG